MSARFTLAARAAGVLLHPTSLPGPHGTGDLGPAARELVDFLAAAGCTWWQMLPVGPVDATGSPYSAASAFAGNPLLISLELLRDEGLLQRREVAARPAGRPDRLDFAAARAFRLPRLRRAFERFRAAGGLRSPAWAAFIRAESGWLGAYAAFCAQRAAERGRPWVRWGPPPGLRRRQARRSGRLERWLEEVSFQLFLQYTFQRQWAALQRYAHARGVGLIGDIPIFVAHDSADVWANAELFDLLPDGRPRTVSGVPPDYFSRTGQLWGHPHYRWARHRATGFAWWLARFRRMFALFDAVRIDHFLGFNRVWAVPGRARTARHGRWVRTPGRALFAALRRRFGRLEVIAEDLGLLVPAAEALRRECGFSGMRLLQFAFGDDRDDRYHQPHTYPRACAVYPGTHDNETTAGWFARLAREHRRRRRPGRLSAYRRVLRYTGTSGREIHWDFIRLALASPADTAIVPAQDLLGLDNAARMNTPATTAGNWRWRLRPGQLTPRIAQRFRDLVDAYGRAPAGT